jgi:DNA-binding FadR family transcriptional regulator
MNNTAGIALSESIRGHIKDYIVAHSLRAGDPLPGEGQLAKLLGVSRSPVREAVKALQSLGIVEAKQGRGLFVREWNLDPMLETLNYGMRISPRTLAELYQIRVWLEMAVIGDVIKRISDADITELQILMLRWERAVKSGEPYVEYDEAFHQVIIGVMENDTLLKFFKVFWLAFDDYGDSELVAHDAEAVLAEHQLVLEAIKKRDPIQARRTLLQQFAGFEERISEILAQTESEDAVSV